MSAGPADGRHIRALVGVAPGIRSKQGATELFPFLRRDLALGVGTKCKITTRASISDRHRRARSVRNPASEAVAI